MQSSHSVSQSIVRCSPWPCASGKSEAAIQHELLYKHAQRPTLKGACPCTPDLKASASICAYYAPTVGAHTFKHLAHARIDASLIKRNINAQPKLSEGSSECTKILIFLNGHTGSEPPRTSERTQAALHAHKPGLLHV